MKRTKYTPSFMGSIEPFEGESIEIKVSKLIENNEPITDGAPIIFTEKKDGVLPQYDINEYRDWETDRKSTRLNSSHSAKSRMPSSA